MHVFLFSEIVKSKVFLTKMEELTVIFCKKNSLHIAFSKDDHNCSLRLYMLFCSVTLPLPNKLSLFPYLLSLGWP